MAGQYNENAGLDEQEGTDFCEKGEAENCTGKGGLARGEVTVLFEQVD